MVEKFQKIRISWTQRGTSRVRRRTVAAVALPDTRQRLRRGAELLGGVRDGDAIGELPI